MEAFCQLRVLLPDDSSLGSVNRNRMKPKPTSVPLFMLVSLSFLGQELTFKEEFITCDSKLYSQQLECRLAVLLGSFGNAGLYLRSGGRRIQTTDAHRFSFDRLADSHFTAVFVE
jgi:hypothetical protein